MPQPPHELARTFVETIRRVAVTGRDDADVLRLVHPDAELRPIITDDVLHGHMGAVEWIELARSALVWEPAVRRVVGVDDETAVALIHLRAPRPHLGIVDSEIAWVAEFRDGLLRRATSYPSVDGLPDDVRAALNEHPDGVPYG
ncbi:MAG TPA: hypothetical protein VE777_05890 [Gaiellales bacterium]|nr:hypothetical protein [Gaiellales bacterium]